MSSWIRIYYLLGFTFDGYKDWRWVCLSPRISHISIHTYLMPGIYVHFIRLCTRPSLLKSKPRFPDNQSLKQWVVSLATVSRIPKWTHLPFTACPIKGPQSWVGCIVMSKNTQIRRGRNEDHEKFLRIWPPSRPSPCQPTPPRPWWWQLVVNGDDTSLESPWAGEMNWRDRDLTELILWATSHWCNTRCHRSYCSTP